MSTATSPWLSARAASLRAGFGIHKIHNWALAGRIRTKVMPGASPKFHAEDVDRVAAEERAAAVPK